MDVTRFARTSGSMRGAPVLAAALALTASASVPAAAAARPSGAVPRSGPAAGVISTVAGGVGGPAKATTVGLGDPTAGPGPCGVSFGAGRLYIADSGSVRVVTPRTDRLTTLAGTGGFGPFGDRGPATKASLIEVCGAAPDHSGNLLIADRHRGRIRLVAATTGTFYGQAMTAGHIYTIAGGGTSGLGDGGPATKAELNGPNVVAVDATGNVLIADTNDQRIRVVAHSTGTFYGQAMTAGDIYTVAGGGTNGLGDGGPATSAELSNPQGVALDATRNLLIGDSTNERIRVVAATTGTFYGQPMTAGDIYTIAGTGTSGFSGDGGPATSAEVSNPQGVAVDATGNLLIDDAGNQRIRVVAHSTGTFYGQPMTAGDIYTIAGNGTFGFSGDGGPATKAEFRNPFGLALDAAGNVLTADSNNYRVRVVAASTGTFYGQAMTAGDIYTIAGNGTLGFSGDGRPATSGQLSGPDSMRVDTAGNVLIADAGNNRIRVVAHSTGTFYGQAMTAGDIYTIAGNGTAGFSSDGGPATKAELSDPEGVAVGGAGNLLIADTGNQRIRVVAARTGTFYGQAMTAGHIYTIAGDGSHGFFGDGGPATNAAFNFPGSVAVDAAGNVVIADTDNQRIRVVAHSTGTFYGQAMTAGDIYTITGNGTPAFSGDGGPATSAEVNFPQSVAVDATGNVLIADYDNNRVRVVAASTSTFYGQPMTAGDIYTITGNGTAGFSGDGGPATSAELFRPTGVAMDATGNVLIADTYNQRIRVVAARTGTFYGRAMTAGDIYTVAGNGHRGFSGDGARATGADLGFPGGVAADAAGNLLIADTFNNRIRKVTG